MKNREINKSLLLYQRLLSLIEEEKRQEPSPFLFSKIENKINNLSTEEVSGIGYRGIKWNLKPLLISACIVIGVIVGVVAGNNVPVTNNTGKNITTSTNIISSSTKGFYLYGVDDEAI